MEQHVACAHVRRRTRVHLDPSVSLLYVLIDISRMFLCALLQAQDSIWFAYIFTFLTHSFAIDLTDATNLALHYCSPDYVCISTECVMSRSCYMIVTWLPWDERGGWWWSCRREDCQASDYSSRLCFRIEGTLCFIHRKATISTAFIQHRIGTETQRSITFHHICALQKCTLPTFTDGDWQHQVKRWGGGWNKQHCTPAAPNGETNKNVGWYHETALCISLSGVQQRRHSYCCRTTFIFCMSALHPFVIPSSVWYSYSQAASLTSQNRIYIHPDTIEFASDALPLHAVCLQSTVSGHFQPLQGGELVFPLLSLHSPPFFSTEPSTHRWALPGIV